jgi:hypothetical protein
MSRSDYWEETIAQAAEECELLITPEQLKVIAEAVEISHDNYGMAFYSPPDHERIDDIEKEWKMKLADKQRELDRYINNAETAIKQALRQRPDTHVTIGNHGEVFSHGGRTTQIQ